MPYNKTHLLFDHICTHKAATHLMKHLATRLSAPLRRRSRNSSKMRISWQMAISNEPNATDPRWYLHS